jgi:Recombination endonuclease VII
MSVIINIPAKKCSNCKLIKTVDNFGKDKNNRSGLKSWCNQCNCELAKLQRFRDRDRLLKVAKEYNKKYKETRKAKHVEKIALDSTYNKRGMLKTRYGLSYEEYLILLEESDNSCQICGITNSEYNELYNKDLSIDHCHETKYIRGILCDKCNTGLGQFKENKELLVKAIEYLQANETKIAEFEFRIK